MSKFRAVANTERGTRVAFMCATTVTVFICLLLSTSADGAVDNLNIPPNTGCACPGDELTFTCTIIGIGNTIWRGSAFDCESSSNQIILRHSQFAGEGTMGSCTSGSLRANSLGVENGNCYVSELNATVQASFDGQSIGCYHNSVGTRLINESVLNVVSVANPSPPQNLNLVSISAEQVLFSWTALPPPCSLAEYTYIISSDCGVCPPSTNTPTVTCTGFQLPTESNSTTCTFTVNSRLCGITGDISAEALLRVPNVPSIENVIPSYLNDTKELKRLLISVTKNETEVTMNDVSGVISTYNLSLTTLAAGPTVSISIDADSGSCDENTCTYTVDVQEDVCMSSSNLSTALSARNKIGQGFPSNAINNIGCTNEFVRLYFNATTSIFTCVFINELDTNEKFCSIRFTRGGQELPNAMQERSTNTTIVSLDLGDIANGVYSFIVSASSHLTTVQVEGAFRKGTAANNNIAIIVGIVVPVVVIVILISVCAVIVCITCRRRKSLDLPRYQQFPMMFKDSLKLQSLDEGRKNNFTVYKVKSSCALRDGMVGKTNWKGHVYHELSGNDTEDIPDDREILLVETSKDLRSKEAHESHVNTDGHEKGTPVDSPLSEIKFTGQLLTFGPDVTPKTLHDKNLIGEGITREVFGDKYRVFIQSKGSGSRHLAQDTWVLYEKGQAPYQNDRSILSPVPKDYFLVNKVAEKVTLGEFWATHGLQKKKLNVFIELTSKPIDIEVRDALLMNKNTKQLFSHPMSLRKVKNKLGEIDSATWRVLVLGEHSSVILEPGMWVAYENPDFAYWLKFCALEVKTDNVRLSDFILKETGTFERGKCFYEFTKGDVEDLLHCRKAINIQETLVQQLMVENYSDAQSVSRRLESTIATFYGTLPNAPGEAVSPPASMNNKLFIHSTSQGARCLKKGTAVLYICGVDDSNVNIEQKEDGTKYKVPVGSPPTDDTQELITAQNGTGTGKTTNLK